MKIKETYIDEWLFFDNNFLNNNPTFVEIGSFTANHAKGIKKKYETSKAIIYEASKKNFNTLKNNIENYDIVIHNKGIADKKEIKNFYDFQSPSSGSIFKRGNRHLLNSSKIDFITVDDIFNENNIDYIDVLFMNCEGSELLILDYILENKEIQNRIGQISISFHPQIYGIEKIKKIMLRVSDNNYYSHTNNKKWPCTLLIKNDFNL
jgi:FkbM family methyltransferase